MENIIVSIQNPCRENWDNMSPTEKGRFCGSCQKEVIDFTKMSDAEMYKYLFALKGNKFCCSALPQQLDRPIFKPKEPPKPLSWYWNYIMAFLLLFAKSTIKAQTIKGEITSMPVKKDSTLLIGKILFDKSRNETDSIIKPDSNKNLPNPTDSSAINANTIIRIGGARSITADSEPLYVIDGKIIKHGLNKVKPGNIESVNVLKGKEAIEKYGKKGGNGVVIIITKSGH